MNSDINWVKLGPSFLHPYIFMNEYLYIDSEDYEIDKLLMESDVGLTVFNKYEGVHPDHPGFKICMIKCFKRNSDEMERVLRKLDWKLNVYYGKKYTDFRDELFKMLKANYNVSE